MPTLAEMLNGGPVQGHRTGLARQLDPNYQGMTHTGQQPQGLPFARGVMGSIQDAPGNIAQWAQNNPVDAGFMAASSVPVIGDAIGFGKDIYDMSPMGDVPFNMTNAGLAGAGLLPFVPAGMGAIKKVSGPKLTKQQANDLFRSTSKQRRRWPSDRKAERDQNIADVAALRDARPAPLTEGYGGDVDPLIEATRSRAYRLGVQKRQAPFADLDAGLWSKKFKDDVLHAAKIDSNPKRAASKANMEAVPRLMKKEGWSVRHSSKDRSGRSSSRYIVSPDGKFEVRLSDHYLPETPQRDYTQGQFGTRWDSEVVLTGNEGPQDIIDKIIGLYKKSF